MTLEDAMNGYQPGTGDILGLLTSPLGPVILIALFLMLKWAYGPLFAATYRPSQHTREDWEAGKRRANGWDTGVFLIAFVLFMLLGFVGGDGSWRLSNATGFVTTTWNEIGAEQRAGR